MKRYHLLVLSNFLAAVGGGIILNAGIGAFRGTFLKGSVMAFFAGAVIGLLLLRLLSQRWARSRAPWFSICVGILSLVLFQLNPESATPEGLTGAAGIVFTVVLSARFGLWFFARALRAQTVGGEKQGIALIELGYYTGVAAGLFLWKHPGWNPLLVDAMLQTVTGLIDFTAIGNRQSSGDAPPVAQGGGGAAEPAGSAAGGGAHGNLSSDKRWYWKLAVSVTCLTVGFQAVPFSLTGEGAQDWRSYVMGSFYTGVALSALACRVFKIKFCCGASRPFAGNATIGSERDGIRLSFSFALITLVATASMMAALWGIRRLGWESVLALIAVAAFTYQILVLSLLDHIARTEKLAGLNELVMRTYLLAAVVTIISLWVLERFPESYAGRAALTLVCSAISFSAIRESVDVRV